MSRGKHVRNRDSANCDGLIIPLYEGAVLFFVVDGLRDILL